MLFRRIAAKTQTKEGNAQGPQELFLTLSPGVKLYIRGLLLECFAEEPERSARNKVGDAVAEVARQLSDAGMSLARVFVSSIFLFHSGGGFFWGCPVGTDLIGFI